MYRHWIAAIVVVAAGVASRPASADVRLPALFTDNLVLQHSADVAVWGWANPGENVKVAGDCLSGEKSTAAGADGRWKAVVKTKPAGGPFTLTIAGQNTLVLKDVLLGEVWLCSGQSNMEWSVGPAVGPGSQNYVEELKNANYSNVRFFTVQKKRARTPQDNCEGQWQACTPETAAPFSAVAYFFGRKLHEELKVPIGLIHSSWGGTEIELWMSMPTMRKVPELAAALDRQPEVVARHEQEHGPWLRELEAADAGWNKWSDPQFDDSDWVELPALSTFDNIGLADFDGVVWYRGRCEVPAEWAGQAATLELGAIDDEDITWINGVKVGATENYQARRRYEVPAGVIKAGQNRITIRVRDLYGAGGFATAGQPELRRGDARLGFSAWRFKVGVDQKSLRPEPRLNRRDCAVLYNGMIAPLIPYALRGVIWYQGESNVPRAFQYRAAFPALIRNWRDDWGLGDFPFYYVQIAPFEYGFIWPKSAECSPELREAQLFALATPNTGMVVTTDITADVSNIHPPNKQDVGARLAAWALAKTYGRSGLEYSGPLYRSMMVEDGRIRVSFDHVGRGLVARGAELTHFTIAGEDRKFVAAQAKIDGDTVVVSSAQIAKPAAVRLGWSDTATPNLFNQAGLPASPFRTDDWPGLTVAERW